MPDRDRDSGGRGPFVGRDRELAALRGAVAAACEGRGQLFLIVGEAGIGKTRLTEEIAREARSRMRVLVGRCFEGEGAPPFWPWVQIVRAYAATRDAAMLRAELGAAAADIAHIVPELRAALGDPAPAPALDPAHARFRVFDGMAGFLAAAARREPLLLVLDDLHWADRPSLLLLAFLARVLPDAPLLVAGTYRDTEVRPAHPLLPTLAELAREPACQRLELRGLSTPDVARFIELHAGRRPPDDVAATVHAKSEGNPFFIAELVRLLAEEQNAASGGAAPWHHSIPQGVRAVIARRLNRLSEECNRTLVLASAFGREFALQPLVRVADRSVEQTLDSIDEALRAGAVTALPGGAGRYAFSHALVRESLYEELGAIRRTRLHRRIAETLVELAASEPRDDQFAHHYFQAALGGECVAQAIDCAVRAAEQALGRLAYEKAAEYFELALRGLALAAPDEPRRGRLFLALGDAFARAGDVERARDAYLQAAGIARQLGDADAFASAALGYGGIIVGVGTVDDSLVRLLEESLQRLGEADGRLRAVVLARLASELYFDADGSRRAGFSEQAVAMARRVGDAAALATALESRHFCLWGMADPRQRLALANEIVRLAEQLDDRELLLRGHHFRVTDLLEMGDVPMVDEAIAAYRRLAEELRQPAYFWRLETFRAMRALMTGRFAEAESLAMTALGIGRRVQQQTAANFFGVQLFSLRREQGRLAELEDAVRTFVDSYPAVPSWRSALASLYGELGRLDEARREIERLGDFRRLPSDNSRLMGLTLLAEACAAAGDRARAATLYELLLPHAAFNVVAGTAAACNGSVARPLGLLAAALERWNDAAQHFEAALRINGAMGARPFVARTQVEYAAMILQRAAALPAVHGEGVAQARGLLEAAGRTATELGMQGVEARVRQLLAADGGASCAPAPPPEAVFHLDGEVWTLRFAGEVCRVKDARGLHYLAALLAAPHADLHAIELVQRASGSRPAATLPAGAVRAEELAHGTAAGSAGARLDAVSRRAYRRRLRELQDEVRQPALAPQRAAAAQQEIAFLSRELGAGVGLGGRDRPLDSDAERARVSVTRAIKLALTMIEARHAALAAHLTRSVRTGTYCSYAPPADQPVEWRI